MPSDAEEWQPVLDEVAAAVAELQMATSAAFGASMTASIEDDNVIHEAYKRWDRANKAAAQLWARLHS